jgi:hypothetical protein
VRHKNVRVADVLTQTPLNVGLTRVLRDGRCERWLHLVQRLINVQLFEEPDSFIRHLTTFGIFTVKSLYEEYMNEDTRYLQKYIWKSKIQLKIKISMWFLHKKVLLTKDNLSKGNWIG